MSNIIKKKVVLIPSAYSGKVLNDIMVLAKFYCKDFDVYIISDLYEQRTVIDGITYVKPHIPFSRYLISCADYLIDAGASKARSRISARQKRVSVWHGIPYKKMYFDLKNVSLEELEYSLGYDLMLSPSKFYSENYLRKSMKYPGEIFETTMPRTIDLLEHNTAENISNLKDNLKLPQDKKIVLYAPTYREVGNFKLPFDLKKVQKHFGEDYIVISKMHYLNSFKNVEDVYKDFTNYDNINDLLLVADVLITDYSSLMFDYSVLNKSLLLFQYDFQEYETKRGFMFDMNDFLDKKFIANDINQLFDSIEEVKKLTQPNSKKLKENFYTHNNVDEFDRLIKKLDFDPTPYEHKEIIFLTNDLHCPGGVHSFASNLAANFKEKYNMNCYMISINHINRAGSDFVRFDRDNIFDTKISFEANPLASKDILLATDGYIISCQFSAHVKFQSYFKNKNVVTMFHGNAEDMVKRKMYNWQYDVIVDQKIGNYKKLCLLTNSNATYLQQHLSDPDIKNSVTFIENSFDFTKSENLYKKSRDFVTVTRLDVGKNIFELFKIFKHKDLDPNVRVFVYGDGILRDEFVAEIAKNNLENRIIYMGYCEDKKEMFKDKEGMISTSLSEGFHLVSIEAINYYIPSYVYDSYPAAKDVISGVGETIKVGDIDGFVDLLNNPPKIPESKFKKKQAEFDNSVIIKKWDELLNELDSCKSIEIHKPFLQKINRIPKYIKKNTQKVYRKIFPKAFRAKTKVVSENIKMKYDYHISSMFINKKELVSIIIPYYYSSKTIGATLESIRKQSYKNIEIIIINDGSDDYMPPKDPKIKYIYQKENTGLGIVRNNGVKEAKGKYIFFLDSDDTISKYGLSFLVFYAEKNKLALTSGLTVRYNVHEKTSNFWFANIYNNNYINEKEKRYILLSDTLTTNKLYNKEELLKRNIKYELGLYEDKLFSHKLYNSFDKIGIINQHVYTWFVYGDNTSITTKIDFNNCVERLNRVKEVFEDCKNIFKPTYIRIAIAHDFRIIYNSFGNFSESEKKKLYEMMKDILVSNEEYYLSSLIVKVENDECAKALLNNDYEHFSDMANLISTYN